MQLRRYGRTDLHLSPICFGPMRFSAKTPGGDDKSRQGERALSRALERGVNFLHSSYEYGTRWAMEETLRAHPQRGDIKHIIKVPIPDFKDAEFSADKFRGRIEEALRDLHTDQIHIVQWLLRADPNDDATRIPRIAECLEPTLEIFNTLRATKAKSAIWHRFLTRQVSPKRISKPAKWRAWSPTTTCSKWRWFPFFDVLKAQGYGFIGIRPFLKGCSPTRALTPINARRRPRPRSELGAALRPARQSETGVGRGAGLVDEFRAAFCLADPRVTSVVVGLNSEKQVDEVCDAVADSLVGPDVPRRVYEAIKADLLGATKHFVGVRNLGSIMAEMLCGQHQEARFHQTPCSKGHHAELATSE